MKKLLLIVMMCLMAQTMQAQSAGEIIISLGMPSNDSIFVDLGLPSGTDWCKYTEGFYTYDEAVSQFGRSLPTKEQWEELKDECQWTWNGSGYNVTGPNGNSIVLPVTGRRNCFECAFNYVGVEGYYWSSTPSGSYFKWCLHFSSNAVYVSEERLCNGLAVQVVRNK